MKAKSKKIPVNILKALQCFSAVVLLYLSLCAIFRDDSCEFYVNDGLKINAYGEAGGPIMHLPYVSNLWYFKLPQKMVSPEKLEDYDIIVDDIYSPQEVERLMRSTVKKYNEALVEIALVMLVIGLTATGIKLHILRNSDRVVKK